MSAAALLLVAAALVPPSQPCDVACERRAAAEQLDRGEIRAAVEQLRGAVARYPDDLALTLLLTRAYMLEGNLFWAERSLRAALARKGASAEPRLWLACVHLREGDPELARRDLAAVTDLPTDPLVSRKALLEAFRLHLVGDRAAAGRELATVDRDAVLFSEDRPVWRILHRRLDHWWLDPVSGELELAAGRTSNALAGAPTDPGSAGTASWLGDVTVRARIAPPLGTTIRPVLDLESIGHGLQEPAYRELSSLQGSARIAALLTGQRHRFLLGYRAERLYLDQTPALYAEARRGEAELEWASGLLAFAGGGHRGYRDERRTRNEWDAGVGGPVHIWSGISLVAGATVRWADARSRAYDLRGASLAAAARFGLGRGFTGRLTATASWDDYLHSGGREGEIVFGTAEHRRDLLGKVTLGVWSPPRHGVRAGLDWQLARRDSTADIRRGFDFAYRESRARVLLRWTFSADPWAPRTVRPSGYVPLAWGMRGEGGDEDERIIDLLRQDEELRRGSSCGL